MLDELSTCKYMHMGKNAHKFSIYNTGHLIELHDMTTHTCVLLSPIHTSTAQQYA